MIEQQVNPLEQMREKFTKQRDHLSAKIRQLEAEVGRYKELMPHDFDLNEWTEKIYNPGGEMYKEIAENCQNTTNSLLRQITEANTRIIDLEQTRAQAKDDLFVSRAEYKVAKERHQEAMSTITQLTEQIPGFVRVWRDWRNKW